MSDELNWGDLYKENGEDEAVPKGKYDVECVGATFKKSGNGNPMFNLTLKLLSGPKAGRNIFTNLVMTMGNPNAMTFFFRKIGAFGLDKSFFMQSPQPSNDAVARALIGRKATVDVSIQTSGLYSGRNNVDNFYAFQGAAGSAPALAPAPAPAPAPVQPGPTTPAVAEPGPVQPTGPQPPAAPAPGF